MTIEIRALRPDELESWLDLRERLWPDFSRRELSSAGIEAITSSRTGHTFVAADTEGVLHGFVEVTLRDHAEGCRTSPVGYVEGWYVEPDRRGEGLGRELIGAAERWALERGASELASDTELDNGESQRAHGALGFREIARVVLFAKRLR